jgi:hypothetical protein
MTIVLNGTTGITSVNGSAAAPSVTGTDTDTGIVYGTNTLSLATGGVAAVTVGSTGNVDIPVAGAVLTLNRGAYSQQTKLYQDTGGTGAIYETTNPSVNAQYYAHVFKGTNNAPTTLNFAKINEFGIGLGSASPSSGTGITFPATQSASTNANTLDDYEEGTWTPTINLLGTLTYTGYQNGTYTKIGSMVTIRFIVGVKSTDGTQDSSAIQISGLPFTTSATLDYWTNGITPCFTEYLSTGLSPSTASGTFGVGAYQNTTVLQLAVSQYNGQVASKSYMTAAVPRNAYSNANTNMYIAGQMSYIASA